ncbi:MAG: 3-hydroxyacyl-ACP dehydratase FabZ [Candidatus Omnitrophota bacterium]|jgi:3-hydroxyacyl-[acyl-carrier-protein] dehydratase
MQKQLNIEDIKKLLPQRFPFLMIDRVVEASPDKVVAIKNVTASEQFFKGHFPEQPVMPGALMIEAMAQTGIILYKQKYPNDTVLYLVSVKSRFTSPVIPGDQLRITVEPVKMMSKMGIFKAVAMVQDKKVAEAEIAFGSQDAKSA